MMLIQALAKPPEVILPKNYMNQSGFSVKPTYRGGCTFEL